MTQEGVKYIEMFSCLSEVTILFWMSPYLNILCIRYNKQLSYRRETELQGGLVMAKSGRLEWEKIFMGNHCEWRIWPAKLSNSVNKAKKGYFAVQGHSWSSRSVSIESPYATWLLVINSKQLTSCLVPFRSYRSVLFKLWTLCVSDPFGA